MSRKLEGKTAMVVGSARGIGRAMAEALAANGANLVLVDWDEATGQATTAALVETGTDAIFVPGDTSSRADTDEAVRRAVERFGGLHILCQNAGIFPQTLIEDISRAEWDDVLAVNLRGAFHAVQSCLGPMRAQRYGRIVLTSSITGARVGQPRNAHYAASKAGMIGFMRTAAIEFARANITINAVEPGNILTEGIQDGGHDEAFFKAQIDAIPLGRLGNPADVAAAAVFLASDDASYITGQSIVIDGGQILPEGAATV